MEYNIKMDGEYHTFENGAIRYTKDGKGRPDLIPTTVFHNISEYLENHFIKPDKMEYNKYLEEKFINCNPYNIIEKAYGCDYVLAIILLIYYNHYQSMDEDQRKEQIYPSLNLTMRFNREIFDESYANTLYQLAIHFEKGAEKYGERNCEKGIPLESFHQSGLRHLTQYLSGMTDENHYIAAIWNFWMAVWTINNMNVRAELENCI